MPSMSRRRRKRTNLAAQWRWQAGRCFYCDCETWFSEDTAGWQDFPKDQRDKMATIEHLVRLADGSDDGPENTVMACYECNSGRQDTPWQEYLDRMETKARANLPCTMADLGYGHTFPPPHSTPEFRIGDTYFAASKRDRRQRKRDRMPDRITTRKQKATL